MKQKIDNLKVNYSYIISAYHDKAEKEEILAETITFLWKKGDTKKAKEHALKKAYKKWSEDKGYYGHEVNKTK